MIRLTQIVVRTHHFWKFLQILRSTLSIVYHIFQAPFEPSDYGAVAVVLHGQVYQVAKALYLQAVPR